MEKRILLVDDESALTAGLSALLQSIGWQVEVAGTARRAVALYDEFRPDLVLLDVGLPDASGLDVLNQIKAEESTPVIMMSGAGSIDIAVEAMKHGAETFIQKPFEFSALEALLAQAERIIQTRKELAALRHQQATRQSGPFAGISAAARRVNELVLQVAPSAAPVLLQGESGTGKGVLARLIHDSSPRARAPFVDLNCAGLSKELLESELFGHERGAFTSAVSSKPGLLELAQHGTLFLDEIGEMEISIQARLLKAVEEKRFRRVGGVRDLSMDFRLITATNRDLAEAVAEGRFRKDLYFRLNVVVIQIPPLRERREDVPLLAEHLLDKLAREIGAKTPRLQDRALRKLTDYSWPGNVRELRNVLERAMLISRDGEIRVEHIIIGDMASVLPHKSPFDKPLEEWEIRPLEEVSTKYVRQAVAAVKGNMRKAARLLGISPSTLYARLKE